MWSRLDDALPDHPKIHEAGRDLGKNGRVIALGVFALALSWANRHLTDGYLPDSAIESFKSHMTKPIEIFQILCKVGLMERENGGYRIHDFLDYNQSAETVNKRRRDRHLSRSNRANQ